MEALAALDPHDDVKYRSETLRRDMKIERDDERAKALAKLLPLLPAEERHQAFDSMLHSCLGLGVTAQVGATVYNRNLGRSFMMEQAAEISALLNGMGGPHCASEVTSAVRDSSTWWP
jgi:hypothetical protein